MSLFSRHISAAAAELADAAHQYEARDLTLAGACLANSLRDLAVCTRELTDRGARPVIAKSLALQLRRIAQQLDPDPKEVAAE
jgi:hypothetical protein